MTRLHYGAKAPRLGQKTSVVTIGVFDGVHTAHQYLIQEARRQARRLHAPCIVITFDPDPQQVLNPQRAAAILMPLSARLAALSALGVDWIWVIPFNRRFARVHAETFVRRVLMGHLHAQTLVVGEGFAFGRNRLGNMQLLRALGSRIGMHVMGVPELRRDGKIVSSSRIRHLIHKGALLKAKRLLGRPASIYGIVVRGAGRGRTLGFPTANLRLTSQVIPPQGVYAVFVQEDKTRGSNRWPGVMNLGHRPTFGGGPMACEVHLMGCSKNLLGRSLTIYPLAKLRNERCFKDARALSRQIERDVRRAARLLSKAPLSS
ncbi:MAG: riboflavin biosynthesis protein RibF [Candidatus Omnitrophica bacterium]|nr:riboflavin biosynthesis protein RibF [Candidatus Omnitrophota bacterium]MBI2174706.1 riboflavin biosynthesis protein RibF [Candidatus Omnitrophota bacterium]MBI3010275.1 riboflavin biosynthesis protein RibF [Candidatus Omnitrophota bacterium]